MFSPTRHLLLLASIIIVSSWSATTGETFETPAAAGGSDWLDDCHAAGFDPMQLACRTCELLPTVSHHHHQTACLQCCQSYKDVERMSKPYEAAVLVTSGRSFAGEELDNFLQQDWDDLVQAKGATRLMQIVRPERGGSMHSYFRTPPTVLYLLDKQHGGSQKSATDYAKVAKETLVLDGWKRDNIRDMLLTLLP